LTQLVAEKADESAAVKEAVLSSCTKCANDGTCICDKKELRAVIEQIQPNAALSTPSLAEEIIEKCGACSELKCVCDARKLVQLVAEKADESAIVKEAVLSSCGKCAADGNCICYKNILRTVVEQAQSESPKPSAVSEIKPADVESASADEESDEILDTASTEEIKAEVKSENVNKVEDTKVSTNDLGDGTPIPSALEAKVEKKEVSQECKPCLTGSGPCPLHCINTTESNVEN
jgi:hypothetical protein